MLCFYFFPHTDAKIKKANENILQKKKELEMEVEFQNKFKRLKQDLLETNKAFSMPRDIVAPNDDTTKNQDTTKDHARKDDEW